MDLNKLSEVIESIPNLYEIFKSCPYEILKRWVLREYKAGTLICHQGEKSDYLFIIVSGIADVYYTAENGGKYSQAVIEKGQFIGEFEIFDEKPYICSIQALSDLKLLQIKREYFLSWMAEDQRICFYLAKYACHQFYLFSHKAGTNALYPLKTRLCNYLLSASRSGKKDPDGIRLKINKEKLSEELAVTARSVHRILQALKSKNIIETKSGYIVIKDLVALAQEEEDSKNE